jgi:hypothetical protein
MCLQGTKRVENYVARTRMRERHRAVAVLLLLLLLVGGARANSEVYRRMLKFAGWVVVPSEDGIAAGTCFVADRKHRLVITCRHVVGNSRQALVYFPRYEKTHLTVESSF